MANLETVPCPICNEQHNFLPLNVPKPSAESVATYSKLFDGESISQWKACGNCGFGAVMGSKKLKAISVLGTGHVTLADPERLKKLTRAVPAPAVVAKWVDTAKTTEPKITY